MLTKIAESYASGALLAVEALDAQSGGKGIAKEASEAFGNDVSGEFIKQAELRFASRTEAMGDAIDFLVEHGHDKAAEELAEAAEAEAGATQEEAISEEDPDDEVAVAAAIQGAAEVIADQTGADMDNPEEAAEVVAAAEEVVGEALAGNGAAAAE